MRSIAHSCKMMLDSLVTGAVVRLRILQDRGSDSGFASNRGAAPPRWRLLLAVMAACLMLVLGAASVEAQEPQREFSFTGRATINGEPAPLGTTIEIEVNGKIIGGGEVSGDNGKWVVQIDAALIQEGVCEAVFYVNGQPADRQWNRCAVDIRLEVGPEVGDDAETEDAPQVQVDPDEPDQSGRPDELEEAEEPPTEASADDPDDSAPKVQPRSPRTGTGGLTAEERQTSWPVAAFVALGALALASFTVVLVRRRSV